jgi:hypothetical protein
MLDKKRVLLAAAIAGSAAFVSTSASAFWGPFNPWNWGGPGWGGWGPGWGGWPGYGYGAPWGYGYPGYGYGAPWGYGYPAYGYGLPGYAYPYAAPATTTQSSE